MRWSAASSSGERRLAQRLITRDSHQILRLILARRVNGLEVAKPRLFVGANSDGVAYRRTDDAGRDTGCLEHDAPQKGAQHQRPQTAMGIGGLANEEIDSGGVICYLNRGAIVGVG